MLAAVAIIVAAAAGGCSPAQPDDKEPLATTPASRPIAVTRGDLVSIVTLEAITQPSPVFGVAAPIGGKLVHESVRVGTVVSAGRPLAKVDGRAIAAPVTAVFEGWLVVDGAPVVAHLPLARLRFAGFAAVGQAPPSEAYRLASGVLSARVQIKNGPGPAQCIPVAPLAAAGPAADPAEQTMPVMCLIDPETTAYSGLAAMIGLRTAEKSNVLRLPVTAVAGTADRGQVAKIVDGKPVRVDVELGVTDGQYVEIVSGLADGDQVLPFGPNLWTSHMNDGAAQ